MVRRLVLGSGTVGHAVIAGLSGVGGALTVLDDDAGRVEALRDENVAAELADPTDPTAIAGVAGPVATVAVLGDDPATNRAAAAAARDVYPSVCIIAYTGRDPAPTDREAIASTADKVVDHGPAIAGHIASLVQDDLGATLYGLQRTLRSLEGPLGVFTHDNPDPDAIASATALRDIAAAVGLEAEVCYFGEISHQENRAFVNLLELELRQLAPDEFDPAAWGSIALVDHSRPGVNDQLPEDLSVDIVIDHHPRREPVDVRFEDRRSEVGATSTMLADYYRWLGIRPDRRVATALLYGIRVDTRDFGREISEADVGAAAYLIERADAKALEKIESPAVTPVTLDTVARAIKNRVRAGPVLASCVGTLVDRDALAQSADQLLAIDGVTTTMVYGFLDGTVYVSARTRSSDLDIGEVLREAFGRIGPAGGHVDMAGAQLPIGILGTVEDGEDAASLEEAIEAVLTDRFFEVLGVEADFPRGDGGMAAAFFDDGE